ncbi:E3 ubiquitin-protein ligase DCST1 [Leptodactylus fuscus]
MKIMMMEVLQSVPFFIVFILTMGFDRLLIHIFQVIHKHFQVSYVFSVEHKLEVSVGGDTFLARLLQLTVRAFNSSDKAVEIGNNTVCLPNPSIMSFHSYVSSCLPTVGLLSLCFLQVYGYRLRRVIAAFFFPKREKCRVIFLYNHYIRKRKWYLYEKRFEVMRKCKSRQLWWKAVHYKSHSSATEQR